MYFSYRIKHYSVSELMGWNMGHLYETKSSSQEKQSHTVGLLLHTINCCISHLLLSKMHVFLYKDKHLCLVTTKSISLFIQDMRHRAEQPLTLCACAWCTKVFACHLCQLLAWVYPCCLACSIFRSARQSGGYDRFLSQEFVKILYPITERGGTE